MASSGPNVIELALLAGAAYLAYEWLFATPAASTTPSSSSTGTTTSTTSSSSVAYVPPTLTQQLQTLAGAGVTLLNADQWNYYYTSAPPLGLGQSTLANFNTIFFPQGRPPAGTAEPTITAAQFVAAIGNPGLSGYRASRGYSAAIKMPVVLTPKIAGRGFAGGQYTLGDLRRATRGY